MFSSSHTVRPSKAEQRSSWRAPAFLGCSALAGYIAAVVTTPVPEAGFGTSAQARAQERSVTMLPAVAAPLESLPPEATGPLVSEIEAEPVVIPEPDPSISSAPVPLASEADAACPQGMILVEGQYCPGVAQRCLDYLNVERDRCAEFAEGARCVGTPVAMRFCVDQFEYPNTAGVKPDVAVTYLDAEAKCAEQGKRLCTAEEWTLACEGPERLPYPTGNRRDEQACNYDKPYRMPNNDAYANPRTRQDEINRLDQRVASGEMAECVSAYGVHDMTGNVDEWVYNKGGSADERPYSSGLKGGYWGPVRNRCRPMTVDHNEWHSGYQIGFRCCASGQDQSPSQGAAAEDEAPRAEALLAEAEASG